jgi:hypothetical protein
VIEVAVRQQDAGEVPEADSRLQDLTLGALAAVDQKTIFIVLNDLRGEAAPSRGRGCRSAKKKDFKQTDVLARRR